jgi:membrane protein YqaA with SNARE-associated domain
MNFLVKWMYKLKLWMESFAEKKYAMTALFLLAFAESSFFPIPPDVLLIAIAVSAPKKSYRAAFWCSVGSVFGGIFGYFIGYAMFEAIGRPIVEFYHYQEAWASFERLYEEWGQIFLAIAAFSPIPYKVSTIASGFVKMDIIPFVLISTFGRAARFFLVGTLFYFFGPPMKAYIEKYFDKLALAFVALLVGGFVALKFLV